jgi:hypothetical protein
MLVKTSVETLGYYHMSLRDKCDIRNELDAALPERCRRWVKASLRAGPPEDDSQSVSAFSVRLP